nr:zf-HC2 domain-containing protein [Caldimonas sp.]
MNARIVRLGGDEHQAAQQLLPWLVNGTLAKTEAAQVGAHVAQCSACQADLAAQTHWRTLAADAAAHGDVDRGWAALRAQLDVAPTAAPRAQPWWRQGLQLAVAVQAAVILVLAFALVSLLRPAEPYRALGSAAVVDANAIVVFRADATEAETSAALRAAGARIVGGPTAVDAYLLRLPDPTAAALARLRAERAVASVESLQGEVAR